MLNCISCFHMIFVISLAESFYLVEHQLDSFFALKLDKSLCPVIKYNGNIVFKGIIDCAKAALANDIPVVLGNDVGCP